MGIHKAQKALAGAADGLAPAACNLIALAAANTPTQRCTEILSQAVITADEFFQSLNKLIPRSLSAGSAPKRLRDAEFVKVAEWCHYFGHPEWGLRPRTFVILHMIGCTDKIDEFVKDDLSDIALPYSEKNLPRAVTGQARARFLDFQNSVCTGQARNLEKENGPHQHIEGNADAHFVFCKALGDGASGHVDHVIGRWSLLHFARKRISRGKLFREDRNKIRLFENELSHLKALSHRHLVKLFASYTDRHCVGLLMTPVADRNLASFLSMSTDDIEGRKVCLRRFFGCIATAVEYLHSQRVRHKDIKPENILVKDQCVLLADFGTSHHWAEDGSSSTHGTVGGFTLRYCAPEVVADKGSRNSSSDMWSLGCVFIEMCTVLCHETVRSMREFFAVNGTEEPYVRNNLLATDLWLAELRQKLTLAQDEQLLDLCKRLCAYDPPNRPTSSELVAEIFDFESPPHYYGLCCDKGNYTTGSITIEDDERTTTTCSDEDSTITLTVEHDTAPEQLPTNSQSLVYHSPYVEDIETTVHAFFPPLVREHVIEEVGDGASDSLPGSSTSLVGLQGPHPAKDGLTLLEVPKARSPAPSDGESDVTLVLSDFACLWPSCQESNSSSIVQPNDQDQLREHLRNLHGVHEINRASHAGDCSSGLAQEPISPDNASRAVHQPDALCSAPHDPFAQRLAEKVQLRRSRRKQQAPSERQPVLTKAVNDSLSTAKNHISDKTNLDASPKDHSIPTKPVKKSLHTTKNHSTSNTKPNPSASKDKPAPKKPAEESPSSKKSKPTSGTTLNPARPSNTRVRFSDLPESKRPAPLVTSLRALRLDENSHTVNAELPREIGRAGATTSKTKAGARLPQSTMVPSYILASTNRFSQQEIDLMLPAKRLSGMVAPPLFVYGSLMFPSILRARAERYVDPEGVYSTGLARRLTTDSRDWSRIDRSLQQAAEQMTPAVLSGFHKFKPYGLSVAALTKSKSKADVDPSAPEIRGFVIFGLSLEAFDCIVHMYSDSERKRFAEKKRVKSVAYDDIFYGPWFKWETVDVQVGLSGGQTATIEAKTSVWWEDECQHSSPWDIDRYIRSGTFTRLSGMSGEDSIWVEEEEQLAKTMGIKMTVAGDELCEAVLAGDYELMVKLIRAGHDVAAPCSTYGNVLQAASFKGDIDMVDYLLERGCSVHTRGGRYTTPLIAAVVHGHEEVARRLLREGVDILAGGREYTSAVYQAVNFDDVELTHLLLEHGAWLSKDYQELLDLASERGKEDIQIELRRYDVRGLHRTKDLTDGSTEQRQGKAPARPCRKNHRQQFDSGAGGVVDSSSPSQAVVPNRRIMFACLFEAFKLKGRSGKWTGIKAVRVLQAALRAGARESIIDSIRPFLGTYTSLIEAVGGHFGEMIDAAPMTGLVLGSTGDKGDDRGRNLLCDKPSKPGAGSPPPSYNQAVDGSRKNDDEVVCATCDGRGGRKGTGRSCVECAGTGRKPSRSRSRAAADRRCRCCNGTGTVYSDRDKCRACS